MDFKNSDNYKRIFSFHTSIPNRIISRESNLVEFKESFNWGSKDEYAKSIAAFANNKGGYIIFGVKNKPRELVGLQNNNFEDTDEAKITEYLNTVFSPEIIFEKFVVKVRSKTIGILHTYQITNKPVICLKNNRKIKESDIYYRYNARSEKIKYPELKILFEHIKEKERKGWMKHFEKISKIGPTNAAILDIIEGKISGQSGTLVIDKKLVNKLQFIKEGNFQKRGKPVLKLIGDVKPVSVVVTKEGKKLVKDINIQVTSDPDAPEYRLTTPDTDCPYITKVTVAKINKKLKGKWKITNYDLLMIRYLFNICDNPKYYYHPSSGASQYSKKFIDWVIKKFNRNNSFFENNRKKHRENK